MLDLAGPFSVMHESARCEVWTPLGRWSGPAFEEAMQTAIDAYRAIEGRASVVPPR
jgi:hypothetical protein